VTLQLFRPAVLDPEGDHRYAAVIDEGESGIEFYDHAGGMHDVGGLDEEETACADWVEVVPVSTPLRAAAVLAEKAGKTRTAEWLRACATAGLNGSWPDAPAYKGAVVHLADPRPDFADLSSAQLRVLRLQIVTELRQRKGLPEPEDYRRPVIGADSETIGEVWLDGEEWKCRYTKLTVAGFDENPPSFGTRDGAVSWVLTQDRPRIAKLHREESSRG